MINKVILIGRLTKEPDMRKVGNSVVCTFSLAVNRNFKSRDGERGTDFIPIVAWGKTAELCNQYLSKGSQAGVVGRIQTRSYEANDGSKRYVTEVIANEIYFFTPKNNQEEVLKDYGFSQEDIEHEPF